MNPLSNKMALFDDALSRKDYPAIAGLALNKIDFSGKAIPEETFDSLIHAIVSLSLIHI